ncbi:MAG: hypothetical protein IMZ43_01835 [Thermoplasmata archaeon]|nr:hypothetical protein [Thermoplasmata archaeon]
MSLSKNILKGKKQISLVLCILFMMTALTTATTVSNQSPYQLDSDHISYTFGFKEPTIRSMTADNTLYTTLQMQGCLDLGKKAGEPTLPVKFIQLLLSYGTTVASVDVDGTPVQCNIQGMDLVTQPILPYQNEVPIGEVIQSEFLIDTELYASNQLYPTINHGDYHIGYSHGYTIFDISLSPVQYIPLNGQLSYYPEMTLTINLQQTDERNTFFRNSPEDAQYVQSLVNNPDMTSTYLGAQTFEYPGGLCDPADNYDYVIITTTQNGLNYWDTTGTTPYNWESLMDHHEAEGLTCTLVTAEDIDACVDYQGSNPFNDKQAHIREFCKDAYEDWGTSYVLIGGDGESNYIPARDMDSSYESDIDADIYWSNLDNNFNANSNSNWGEEGDLGFDLYSELFLGRLTCDTPQDVSNWMTKSFYYAQSTDYDYIENAAFFAGTMGWSAEGDDFIDFAAIKGTSNWLGPDPDEHGVYPSWLGFQYGFETWNEVNPGNQFNLSVKWTSENPNPGWNGGDAIGQFRNAINNDLVTIISGVAHADPTCSLDVYDSDWESNYHNTRPFFLTDFGCHCGDYDAADDGVLHSMLFHSDTELAFAVVYNTCYGWGSFTSTNSSSAIQMKSFWDYFFDMENNSQSYGNWQFGKGHAWSKDMMAPTVNWSWSAAPGSYRAVIQGCTYFGDPAQQFKSPSPSNPPTQPTKPVGPTLGIWNVEYTYTSSATEPDNEQMYYLFDWGDGSNSGWLGPYSSGQTGTGSHIWTVLGTYDVKVKARDIWGAGSVWSEPLVMTITDNNPPNIPDITGPAEGKPGNQYLYNIVTTDLDGHNIYYFVDWGDNTTTGWLGPYVSGTMIHITHSWTEAGSYTVKAKAKDTMNAESGWGTIDVVMPTEYKFSFNAFLEHLLGMFPHMFPILRHLMGY